MQIENPYLNPASSNETLRFVDFGSTTITDPILRELLISRGSIKKRTGYVPVNGPDKETSHISYNSSCHYDDRVPSLCSLLEQEASSIATFAKTLFPTELLDVASLPPMNVKLSSRVKRVELPYGQLQRVARVHECFTVFKTPLTIEEMKRMLYPPEPPAYDSDFFFEVEEYDPKKSILKLRYATPDNAWYPALAYALARGYCKYLLHQYLGQQYEIGHVYRPLLSDTLAEFFAFLYFMSTKKYVYTSFAKARFEEWKKRYPLGENSSNALRFLLLKKEGLLPIYPYLSSYYKNGSIDLFLNVFRSTKQHWCVARQVLRKGR